MGRGKKEGQNRGRELTGVNYNVQIKLQRYMAQHREYSQYFLTTINGA